MEAVVITRHDAYVTYLVNIGLIEPGCEVIKQATPDMVRGRHVITSGLPLHLGALAERLTTVPLWVPQELRGQELTLAQVEQYAQPAVTYRIQVL